MRLPRVLADVVLTDISTGAEHRLRRRGAAKCWGAARNREIGDGQGNSTRVPRAVDTSGVLSGKTLVDASIGSYTVNVESKAGYAYCWAGAYQGQLGDPTYQSKTRPGRGVHQGALSQARVTLIGTAGTTGWSQGSGRGQARPGSIGRTPHVDPGRPVRCSNLIPTDEWQGAR